MSAEEFLAWDSEDGRLWQLVDGTSQAMAPASRTHGAVQSEPARLIGNHLTDRAGPGSLVVTPGVVPHVQAGHDIRVPDLAVTCSDYRSEELTLADPVLIIEILSPNNQSERWANVWTYTTIPSVRELLVVRTASIEADLLRRRPDGSWPEDPEIIRDGELVLESLGLRVSLAAVYRTTRLAKRPGEA